MNTFFPGKKKPALYIGYALYMNIGKFDWQSAVNSRYMYMYIKNFTKYCMFLRSGTYSCASSKKCLQIRFCSLILKNKLAFLVYMGPRDFHQKTKSAEKSFMSI